MAGKPLYARLGLEVKPTGSASNLAVAIGGMETFAANRIGFYVDDTPASERLGVVVGGTEVARFWNDVVDMGFRSLGPAVFAKNINIGDIDGSHTPVAGDLRWDGVDFEGYDGASWISLTAGGGGGSLGGLSDVTLTSSTTNEVLRYNGSIWVNGYPMQNTTVIATSPYTLSIAEANGLLILDTASLGAAISVTLPDIGSSFAGRTLKIIKRGSTYPATINPHASDTIDGASSWSIPALADGRGVVINPNVLSNNWDLESSSSNLVDDGFLGTGKLTTSNATAPTGSAGTLTDASIFTAGGIAANGSLYVDGDMEAQGAVRTNVANGFEILNGATWAAGGGSLITRYSEDSIAYDDAGPVETFTISVQGETMQTWAADDTGPTDPAATFVRMHKHLLLDGAIELNDTTSTVDGVIKYASNQFQFRENGVWVSLGTQTEVDAGTVNYQLLWWDNGNTKWTYTSGITWDNINSRLDLSSGLVLPLGVDLSPTAANPGLSPASTIWINSADGHLYRGSVDVEAGQPPGGSDTQVQYNSSGVFAGSANFTYDATLATGGIRVLNTTNVNYTLVPSELTDGSIFTDGGIAAKKSIYSDGNLACSGTISGGSSLTLGNFAWNPVINASVTLDNGSIIWNPTTTPGDIDIGITGNDYIKLHHSGATSAVEFYKKLTLTSLTVSSPVDGDIWYDSGATEFRFRENGVTKTLGDADPAGSDTQVQFNNSGSFGANANFTYTVGTGVDIGDTTASTSTVTGALVVAGGVGIGGALYVGGGADFTGQVDIDGAVVSTSYFYGSEVVVAGTDPQIYIRDTDGTANARYWSIDGRTASTLKISPLTDTFINLDSIEVLAAGDGSISSVTIPGTFILSDLSGNTDEILYLSSSGGIQSDSDFTYNPTTGVLDINQSNTSGTWMTFSGPGSTWEWKRSFGILRLTAGTPWIDFDQGTGAISTGSAHDFKVTSTTASSSTSTGALVVSGGVGIADDVYMGGTLEIDGPTTTDFLLADANSTRVIELKSDASGHGTVSVRDNTGTQTIELAGLSGVIQSGTHQLATGTGIEIRDNADSSYLGCLQLNSSDELLVGDQSQGGSLRTSSSGDILEWSDTGIVVNGITELNGAKIEEYQTASLSAGTVTLSKDVIAVEVTNGHASNQLRLYASPSLGAVVEIRNNDGGGTSALVADNAGSAILTLVDTESVKLRYNGTSWITF